MPRSPGPFLCPESSALFAGFPDKSPLVFVIPETGGGLPQVCLDAAVGPRLGISKSESREPPLCPKTNFQLEKSRNPDRRRYDFER